MNIRLVPAVLLPFLALALQWVLWPWIAPFVWFLFFPTVFFSARLGGLGAGLVSTVLSIAIVWFFFIPPQLSWTMSTPSNLYSVGLFLVMGYLFSETQDRLRLLKEGVQDCLNKPFSVEELLARVSGLVLSRRRTVEELSRSTELLRRLAETVEKVASVRDLPSLTTIILRAVRELTGADGATLILSDNGQCHYIDEDAIGPLWRGQRFPLESCVSGWTMLHAEATVIEDITVDPRILYAAYRSTFVKSLSMAPIGRKNPASALAWPPCSVSYTATTGTSRHKENRAKARYSVFLYPICPRIQRAAKRRLNDQ